MGKAVGINVNVKDAKMLRLLRIRKSTFQRKPQSLAIVLNQSALRSTASALQQAKSAAMLVSASSA